MTQTVVEYVRPDGSNPFRRWFDRLDAQAAAKVATATVRLTMGNTSGVKWLGAIAEYRIDWGPDYRVYLGRDGEALIVLLGGGTKRIKTPTSHRFECCGRNTKNVKPRCGSKARGE